MCHSKYCYYLLMLFKKIPIFGGERKLQTGLVHPHLSSLEVNDNYGNMHLFVRSTKVEIWQKNTSKHFKVITSKEKR